MKHNNNVSFVSKFKYLMLIPIVLVLVSVIIGAIFNLNLDYDFRKVSNFSVKFNTTVTQSEYNLIEKKLDNLLENEGFKEFRLERIGTGAQNAILVKIPNDKSNLDSKIDNVKTLIENSLISESDDITSSIVITTTETGFSLPKNVTSLVWYSILAIACIMLFVFFYNWIRYNLTSGISLILSILLEIAMLISSMIAFRIPFNYYFVVPFVVMILTTILNATYMNNYIKSTLSLESYSKTTNKDRVEETTSKCFKSICIYNIMLIALILSVMFFGGPSLIYLGLAIITGLVISIFTSLFINTSIWSFWYKKDKDNVLKRRLESTKRKEDIKSGKIKDEKLVV